jgi:hypothetical protein
LENVARGKSKAWEKTARFFQGLEAGRVVDFAGAEH